MRGMTIDKVLADRALLGAALGDLASWRTWLTVLRAAFGLLLNEDDKAAFRKVAGERKPPSKRVRELWAVVGRRSASHALPPR